jgi:hypothetical protein
VLPLEFLYGPFLCRFPFDALLVIQQIQPLVSLLINGVFCQTGSDLCIFFGLRYIQNKTDKVIIGDLPDTDNGVNTDTESGLASK